MPGEAGELVPVDHKGGEASGAPAEKAKPAAYVTIMRGEFEPFR